MKIHGGGDGKNWEQRFWSLVEKSDSCWTWKGRIEPANGYGRIQVARLGGSKWLAHRLAWKLTYGRVPRSLDVLHRCDNPPCVRPDHLFLGTHQENMADAAAKGRMPSGVKHFKNKLTPEQVIAIRSEHRKGVWGFGCRNLARKYGVSSGAIHHIISGKNWKV